MKAFQGHSEFVVTKIRYGTAKWTFPGLLDLGQAITLIGIILGEGGGDFLVSVSVQVSTLAEYLGLIDGPQYT